MRSLVLAALALTSASLAAQEAPKKEEPPPPPSAELHLVAGTSGISAASWMYGYKNEACEAQKDKEGEGKLATFNAFLPGKRTVKVGVGERYYVLAVAKIEPPVGAETTGKTSCRAMVSFVPEDKHAYEISHDLKQRKCPLMVKDLATGAEVATVQKHKPVGKCKDE
jgi:hypothetical protein